MSIDLETAITDWEKDTIILGIDEAGRGPVLGPMVYACAYWKEEYDENIRKKFKFNDSKALKPEEREKMFNQIKAHPNIIKYELIILPADLISSDMLKREKISLNQISHNSAIELIERALNKKINICKVFVDTVGPPDMYKAIIDKKLNNDKIKVKVEKKADATYECVSAASIVAKVTRDKIIEKLEIEDKDCGSGYTSDPKTQDWLKNNYDNIFGFGREVRFSWKTVAKIFKDNNNKCEWEDYNSDEEIEKQKAKYKKNKKEKDEKQQILNFENKELLNDKNKHFLEKEQKIGFYDRNNIDFNVCL
jgi:ribonuclease H2 subunit A